MKYILNFGLIIFFQLIGEYIQHLSHIPIPGVILGMTLFFLYLLITQGGGENLQSTGHLLLRHLSLFFIPAGAGLIAYQHLISSNILAIGVALIVGVFIAFVGLILIMKRLSKTEINIPKDDTL
jgi:holin-like protein